MDELGIHRTYHDGVDTMLASPTLRVPTFTQVYEDPLHENVNVGDADASLMQVRKCGPFFFFFFF